jgi:hypothetical protein
VSPEIQYPAKALQILFHFNICSGAGGFFRQKYDGPTQRSDRVTEAADHQIKEQGDAAMIFFPVL